MTTSSRPKRLSGSPLERIYKMADRSGECWLWTGHLNSYGYAELKLNGRVRMAHRVAYEELVGQIPEGLQLDHLCRIRRCVNPIHLEPVTNKENALRGVSFSAVNARKTHCLRGHALDVANTYVNPAGARVCRECKRARERRYKAARRAS